MQRGLLYKVTNEVALRQPGAITHILCELDQDRASSLNEIQHISIVVERILGRGFPLDIELLRMGPYFKLYDDIRRVGQHVPTFKMAWVSANHLMGEAI